MSLPQFHIVSSRETQSFMPWNSEFLGLELFLASSLLFLSVGREFLRNVVLSYSPLTTFAWKIGAKGDRYPLKGDRYSMDF